MKLVRSIRASLRSLSAHRARATLSTLSIGTGVAAVIVTSALSMGVEREVQRSLQNVGSNLLIVRPIQVKRSAARESIRGVVTTLKPDDFEALMNTKIVAGGAPGAERPVRAKANGTVTLTKVLGTTADFLAVRRFELRCGRFFNDKESDGAERIAVLGSRVSDALFGERNPVGNEIRLNGIPYEVIGVLRSKGASVDGSDEDNQVLIPIRTAIRRVLNRTWLSAIFISAPDVSRMDEVAGAVRARLRERHRLDEREPDDFEIQNTARALDLQRRIGESLSLLGLWLASVAMLIGGTGILALMFLSVKERAGEIGLRIAVGATRRDILVQFMLEATALALAGWMAGLILSSLVGGTLALATKWSVALPAPALISSFVMAATLGLVFGSLPARQAARLHPITALGMK
jgi:putative ABC transport system permease protein